MINKIETMGDNEKESNGLVADNWCETDIRINKTSFKWILNNYNYRTEETGKYIKSSTFSVSEESAHKWSLWLFPNGNKEEYKEYVSVFVALNSESNISKDIKLKTAFNLSLIDSNEQKVNTIGINTYIIGIIPYN